MFVRGAKSPAASRPAPLSIAPTRTRRTPRADSAARPAKVRITTKKIHLRKKKVFFPQPSAGTLAFPSRTAPATAPAGASGATAATATSGATGSTRRRSARPTRAARRRNKCWRREGAVRSAKVGGKSGSECCCCCCSYCCCYS